MDRREYEELVAVHDEGAEVHLHIREKPCKSTVKRMIVWWMIEITFVFVSMHCSFKPEDLQSCSIDSTKVTRINIKKGAASATSSNEAIPTVGCIMVMEEKTLGMALTSTLFIELISS